MLIIRNVKLPIDTKFNNIKKLFTEKYSISESLVNNVRLYKRSIDARKKPNLHYICTFLIESENEAILCKKLKSLKPEHYISKNYEYQKAESGIRPIIVGFGPAGIFCAYALAKAGLRPIVLERGKDVDARTDDINAFFHGEKLDPESNIQFGEGGAGTFSDGKLNTGINDFRIKEVLNIFHKHGAPERITFDAKPHIGTDVLKNVVKSIRNEIIDLGGEILFEHKLIDFAIKDERCVKITVNNKESVKSLTTNSLVLAIGHSARDTFKMLYDNNIKMQPKAFAIGARIEHKSRDINQAQYGNQQAAEFLGAADYKLYCHLPSGRSVFTFCMCPGGNVINASSEPASITTNGMSYMSRNGENSNSAILVNVDVEDYYKDSVLDGIEFQRKIEKATYNIGDGLPVCETVGSFLDKTDNVIASVKPTIKPGIKLDKIEKIFPKFITDALKEALPLFDKKLSGFSSYDAILTVPETRSSSPIRIVRNDDGESNIRSIYPCGEGAGYAGGIMSAAVDGLKVAEKIINKIKQSV